MRTAGRIYDFTLTAGGSMPLLVQGDYMRIMSATGAVEVLTDNYRIGPIMAGQGQAKSPFTRLTITDRSGAANVGYVLVADSDFIDNRINGEVSVIDGEKSRTLAGGMFAAAPFCGAVAANYSNVQLWNPAGSGKNLIVGALDFATPVATSVQVFMTATQLVNASLNIPANKKSGAAAPIALVRYEAKAAPDPFLLGVLRGDYTPANSPVNWVPKGAFVVMPGYGLTVTSVSTANMTLTANFEWFEELV